MTATQKSHATIAWAWLRTNVDQRCEVARWAWTPIQTLRHVRADGAWRDAEAELEEQLVSDTLLAPGGVLPRHPADEYLEVHGNRWPSSDGDFQRQNSRNPCRCQRMNVVGCTMAQSLSPITPAPEPNEGETRGVGGTSGFDLAFLIQRQLFPQKEVFCRKGGRVERTQRRRNRRASTTSVSSVEANSIRLLSRSATDVSSARHPLRTLISSLCIVSVKCVLSQLRRMSSRVVRMEFLRTTGVCEGSMTCTPH